MTHDTFWQDRSVLVTGCTGLLGSCTVQLLLDRGAQVVGLIRDQGAASPGQRDSLTDRIHVVQGPLENLDVVSRAVNEYEVQTVIHLAAQTVSGAATRNPLSTFETNIRGTWTLLEACRRSELNPQVIVASSDKVYGAETTGPQSENAALAGRQPFDCSKTCADLIASCYYHTYDLPVGITRISNCFGPGDLNMSRLVPGTIRSVLRGQRPVIRSDGAHRRDYLYVKDAAAAHLLLAECLARRPELAGEAFNFADPAQYTVLQVVEKIVQLAGSDLTPDVRGEGSAAPKVQTLNADKARTLLQWTPRYTLDQALLETVAWYRRHFGLETAPITLARPPEAA